MIWFGRNGLCPVLLKNLEQSIKLMFNITLTIFNFCAKID